MSGLINVLPATYAASQLLHGLGAFARHTSRLSTKPLTRQLTTQNGKQTQAVYLADCDGHPRVHTPFIVGLFNYLERHMPSVGYFNPIAAQDRDGSVDLHVDLIHKTFGLKHDMRSMYAVTEADATKMIAQGRQAELMDRIYSAFSAARERSELLLVEGTSVGGTDLDAAIAAAINAPVLLTMNAADKHTSSEIFNTAMLKRQGFRDHKVDVLGVVLDKVARADQAILTGQLRSKFQEAGLVFAGGIPEDHVLESVRLDEVRAALGADLIFTQNAPLDQEFDEVIVGSQRVEELLEVLEERGGGRRPLVVTSMDRIDIVLGLLAAQVSVQGPTVAGIVLTQAGNMRNERGYARSIAARIFEGIERGGLYQGSLLPVMATNKPMFDVLQGIAAVHPSILATSTRKIQQCKMLFDRYIDANMLVESLQRPATTRVTPKMFTYNIKTTCAARPQHIVLPEGLDKRILAAGAEVSQRGLAKVTLLGDPELVNAEAKKLGLDISGCKVVSPKASDMAERYIGALMEARQGKGLTREVAADLVANDVNMYGVMMVHTGDADGMVSGAIHTTASTIRPALQVLKAKGGGVVSSVFFMCLPDRVLVYGDCAVNVHPEAEELAGIAITSADTAKAFGIEPRVAMLSYSTLGSGAGPDVQRVVDATALVKKLRPDLMVEGPIQYDAAIDPAVAAVKVKTSSEVAGQATVFIFPDLNTGNNTYKAVQQATGAIAMGPVMQGLRKPVNDLSRGCTVADVINTICVTSVQALQFKDTIEAAKKAAV